MDGSGADSGGADRGGAGQRDEAGAGDRVAAAVEELYDGDPQAFTGRRAELAAAARDAGDRAAAKAIGALRRPTRAAWVVNRLARADPGVPASLAEMAAALRAAQQAGHGPRLRELSAARGALVDALTGQALAVAGVPDPPPALRLEVAQTLTAALADPEVAAAFAAGTLTQAVQWSGFGVLPAAAGGEDEPGEAAEEPEPAGRGAAAADADRDADRAGQDGGGRAEGAPAIHSPHLGVVTGGRPKSGRARAAQAPAATASAATAPAARVPAEAAARRQAGETERLAREASERAAQRREQYAAAQRLVASTATAAAEAVAAEDRLEAEVRDLEERLTRARADLAGARMRARHAEAAERRARQSLDHLPQRLGQISRWHFPLLRVSRLDPVGLEMCGITFV